MERHFATLWEAMADALGDRPAVVQNDRVLTWEELDVRAARLAAAMAARGVSPGDRVAVHLRNVPEFVVVWFAAMKLRAVPTNVHPRYGEDELVHLLDDAAPAVVVTHVDLAQTMLGAVERSTVDPWVLTDVELVGVEASAEPAPRIVRSADDLTLLYTGGTTGLPKGVEVDMGTKVLSDVRGASVHLGEQTDDPARIVELAVAAWDGGRPFTSVVPCPLTHGTGLTIGATTALSAGGTLVLTPHRFDPVAVWAAVRRHDALALVIAGDAMGRPLVAAFDGEPTSLLLLASSGAVLSTEVKRSLVAALAPGGIILDILASSEMPLGWSVTSQGPDGVAEGFELIPGVAVVGDGRVLAPGDDEVGILSSRTPPRGYRGDPAGLAGLRVTVDGVDWYRTGDRARWHADGRLELLGRASTVVNTGGEKVDTGEVEAAILAHRGVHDAIVVGVPDERLGQTVGAVVVADEAVTEADVIAAVRTRLADYKTPRVVRLVTTCPRHDTGKPDYPTARTLLSPPGTARSTSS